MVHTFIPLWDLVLLGQVGDAVETSAVEVQSIWDFVVKGGPMMIPIGVCSLVALTVIVERLVTLRRSNVIPDDFPSGLKKAMDDDDAEASKALAYCQENDSPLAQVFAAAVKRLAEPIELLEKHIAEAGERMVVKLRKYMRVLSVIASISPLMGLLGTIFGMINAFQTVAVSGEALGKTELLARGIYEALITTAAGLLVTIPSVICYHWISSKVDGLVRDIDHMIVEFVEEHARPRRSPIDDAAHRNTNGPTQAHGLSSVGSERTPTEITAP